MGLLCAGWMAYYKSLLHLDASQPYHIAAYRRDRRKARFYFLSVWVGLSLAFLSFLSLEALTVVTFDTPVAREWILGVMRALGTCGLLVVAAVWSQVGMRVSQPNSDGASLQPLPNEKKLRE